MAKTFTLNDGLVPVELLRYAIDHMGAAERLFESSPSHFDSAGYLAHLAVELMLKSWLLQVAGRFSAVHDLSELYDELIEKHGAPALSGQQMGVLALLDRYGELRYPNRNDPVEVGSEHLSEITELMQKFSENLPDELLLALSKVDVVRKGNRVLMKKKISDMENR
jgi:HEPN domain-containing protein